MGSFPFINAKQIKCFRKVICLCNLMVTPTFCRKKKSTILIELSELYKKLG